MLKQQQSTQINEGMEGLKRSGSNGKGRQTTLEGFTPFMQPRTQTIPPGSFHELGEYIQAYVLPQACVTLLRSLYQRKPRYPLEAMVKTAIGFFLSGDKHLTTFYRRLKRTIGIQGYQSQETGLAKQLGYEWDKTHNCHRIPSYSAVHAFIVYRVGYQKSKELFNRAVQGLEKQAKREGVVIGRHQIIDSTPHETKKGDKGTDIYYNGHYKKKMFKEQRIICRYTRIPLSYECSPGIAYDGDYLQPLVEQAERNNCYGTNIWVDGHYTELDNLAYLGVEKELTAHYRIQKSWKWNKKGSRQEIRKLYQKYWNDPGFKPFDDPECTDEFILQFLYKKGRVTEVGHALRNKCIEQYSQTPKQYLSTLGVRSIIEGDFGVDKRMGAVKDWEARTKDSRYAAIGFINWGKVVLAHVRVMNGWRTDFVSRPFMTT